MKNHLACRGYSLVMLLAWYACYPGTLFAQLAIEVRQETVIKLTGEAIGSYAVVGDSQPRAAAIATITGGMHSDLLIKVTNADRESVSFERVDGDPVHIIVTTPGKWYLDAIDFGQKLWETVTLTVGGKPDDPTEPDPPTDPKDEPFDDLAKRVAGWAKSGSVNAQTAAIYEWAAAEMDRATKGLSSATIQSALSEIIKRTDAIPGRDASEYELLLRSVDQDLAKRWPSIGWPKSTMGAYWAEIAKGLRR